MDEEDVGRKLDIGNDLLRMLVKGQGSLIEGQKSMCIVLEKMDKTLEKISEK